VADNPRENISKTSKTVFQWLGRFLRRYWWAVVLAGLVVGAWQLYAGSKGDKSFDSSLADLLLQAALILVGGTALNWLIRHINKQRDKDQELRSKRMDFMRRMRQAHVRVANAQRLIYANQSAKIYSEQMRVLMLVIPELEDIEADIAATTDLFCEKPGDQVRIQCGIKEIVAYLNRGYDEYAEWHNSTENYRTLPRIKSGWLDELLKCGRRMPEKYLRALDKSKGTIRSYVYGGERDRVISGQNEKVVRCFVDELLSAGNLASADELLADDVVLRLRVPAIEGREAFKQGLRHWQMALSDWRISIEQLIAVRDKVVGHWRCEATHSGPLMGVAPTGKRVSWTANDVLRIENGKITEITAEEDVIAIMRQLGAAPEPTSAE
jgi:predicted ester cyclase